MSFRLPLRTQLRFSTENVKSFAEFANEMDIPIFLGFKKRVGPFISLESGFNY